LPASKIACYPQCYPQIGHAASGSVTDSLKTFLFCSNVLLESCVLGIHRTRNPFGLEQFGLASGTGLQSPCRRCYSFIRHLEGDVGILVSLSSVGDFLSLRFVAVLVVVFASFLLLASSWPSTVCWLTRLACWEGGGWGRGVRGSRRAGRGGFLESTVSVDLTTSRPTL
jgi:hypothetical protein